MEVERQGPFFEICIGFQFVNLRIVFKVVTMVYKCQHGLPTLVKDVAVNIQLGKI